MFGAHMSLIFCQIQITFLSLNLYKQILALFKALLFSKRQYLCLIMLIIGVPLWTIDITISSIDICAHHVVYLVPPRRLVRKKICFRNKSKQAQMVERAMYSCRLHNKMKRRRYRQQRDKSVEKYDGWACYPLSLPTLQDMPHEKKMIEELINTHDPS
jgi:hypothetical protein